MAVFVATATIVAVLLFLGLRVTVGLRTIPVTIGTFVLFILGLGLVRFALPENASADIRAGVTGVLIGILVIHLYAFAGILGNLGKRT
ncbi:MAG TPA: hypothetical protein VFS96_01280 [Nitrolancea sp.]|nr:hypothetical protein [Nitrolancea sp.]